MILQVCYSYITVASASSFLFLCSNIGPPSCLSSILVQKRGYVDLQGAADADNRPCCYGYTLPKDSSCTVPSTWAMTDPTTFLIRGETYLHDHLKVAIYFAKTRSKRKKTVEVNFFSLK
jgi:hypothetical protein